MAQQTSPQGSVSGTGTPGLVPVWSTGMGLGDSKIQDGIAAGILTVAKAGVTARTATFPDAAVLLTGSAVAITASRLPKGTATAGVEADSNISDGVTGGVVTIAGALGANRTKTLQNTTATLAELETAQTWPGVQTMGQLYSDSGGGYGIEDLTSKKYWHNGAASAEYALLVTLPIDGAGTYDTVTVEATVGDWSSSIQQVVVTFRNRSGLKFFQQLGTTASQGKILAYRNADNSASIYLYLASGFNLGLVRIKNQIQAVIPSYSALTATAPSGTLIYDSSTAATSPGGAAFVFGTDPGGSSTLRAQGSGFFGGNASSGAASTTTGVRIGTDAFGAQHIAWVSSGGAADAKVWEAITVSGSLVFRTVNDAYNAASVALTLNRSANVFTSAVFGADPGGTAGFRNGGTSRLSGTTSILSDYRPTDATLTLGNRPADGVASLAFDGTTTGTNTNRWNIERNAAGQLGFYSYAGSAYVLQLISSGEVGIGVVPTAGNGLAQLAGGTTPAFGYACGTDTHWYRDSAGSWSADSNIKVATVGKGLYVKEGTNATMGSATLVVGTVVVSTTKVTATSRVFLTSQADGGTVGFLRVSARTAGTSFTVSSSSALDTSTLAWIILEPA